MRYHKVKEGASLKYLKLKNNVCVWVSNLHLLQTWLWQRTLHCLRSPSEMKSFFLSGHSDSDLWLGGCPQQLTQLISHIGSRAQVIVQKHSVEVSSSSYSLLTSHLFRSNVTLAKCFDLLNCPGSLLVKTSKVSTVFFFAPHCLTCNLTHHSHTSATAFTVSSVQSVFLIAKQPADS